MTVDEWCKKELRLLAEFKAYWELHDKAALTSKLEDSEWIDQFTAWVSSKERADAQD